MTESAAQALSILRDGSLFQWYVIPIFLFGYLHFFVVAFLVHDMKTLRAKALTVGAIFTVAILGLAIFIPLGWI